jgi:hypothetical protein
VVEERVELAMRRYSGQTLGIGYAHTSLTPRSDTYVGR